MSSSTSDQGRRKTSIRRATQACAACRQRKTRCDEGAPKCSLCLELGIECVYKDSPNAKIDGSIRLVLDRIQQLEDRIFSSPNLVQSHNLLENLNQQSGSGFEVSSPSSNRLPPAASNEGFGQAEGQDASGLTLPVVHNATADHVYQWPIVRKILARGSAETSTHPTSLNASGATDIFLHQFSQESYAIKLASCNIFSVDRGSRNDTGRWTPQFEHLHGIDAQLEVYLSLVEEYFLNVNVFYPLLHRNQIVDILHKVKELTVTHHDIQDHILFPRYCLLVLVLCLGALVSSNRPETIHDLESQLWAKSRQMLGSVLLENNTEAAQCFLLASVYLCAKGRVIDAFDFVNVAAKKCVLIVRRLKSQRDGSEEFSDAFRRLFWIAYVNESDYAAELSFTPPSGIAALEDLVPYPTSDPSSNDVEMTESHPNTETNHIPPPPNPSPGTTSEPDVLAFQISTNSAIRRFLNRISAVIYDPKETGRRRNHSTYASWLLKICSELEDHHHAIHNNVPSFLLSADSLDHLTAAQISTPGSDHREDANRNWNVTRLKGRYYAGLYVINRPLVEYVLHNPQQFPNHPHQEQILEKCRTCLAGCAGFIRTFQFEPPNAMTNLFATGMAMFTMITILMTASTFPAFQAILPQNSERVIEAGLENLRRFSPNIQEFGWHINELEKLDRGRKELAFDELF